MRIRTARCSNCNQPVQLRDGANQANCKSCGSIMTLEAALKQEKASQSRHRNPTPIKIGMKATFNGVQYEVIGRLVLGMVEDGETYTWQEFELTSADGQTLSLEYDEGGWLFTEAFTPTKPLGPAEANILHVGSPLDLGNAKGLVKEMSRATVFHTEGEFTYGVTEGDSYAYVEATSLNRSLSMTWTQDEIGFYQGRRLSERQVYVAFDMKDRLEALGRQERAEASRRLFGAWLTALGVAAFALWLMALTSGALVQQKSVPLVSVPEGGARFGPFQLDPGMYVHRLVIHAEMSRSSAWVAGVLEKADGTQLIGAQRDFWDERGYDSDGAWHEFDLSTHTDFVVRNPGPYYIRLVTERDTPNGQYGNVGFRLYGRIIYPTYLLVFGIVTTIIGACFFVSGSPGARQSLAESFKSDD